MMNTVKQSITSASLITSITLAGFSGLAALPAQAELSATVAGSNFYLWRGTNISNPSPVISGSLDYSHDLGLYAGIWTSSEGISSSTEYDLYAGYAGEVAGFGYDVSLIDYNYPDSTTREKIGDFSELKLSASYMGASLTIYDSLQGVNDPNVLGGYTYYTLGYGFGPFSALIGSWSHGTKTGATSKAGTEYTHLDLSFAATDELTFTLSQVVDDDNNTTLEDDLLVNVSYSKTFEL